MAFKGSDVGPDKQTGFTYKGREVLLSKSRGRPFTGLVAKGMERGIYPENKYLEAVSLFACTGSVGKVAELTKIPEHTIRRWSKEQKFKDILREIREENNEKIDAKFTEIIEKAADLVLDRLENGDFHWDNKNSELVRRPISAKDLSLVTAINMDKRQLIRGEPTSRTETVSVDQRLGNLAEQFTKLANQFKHAPKLEPVIDVEYSKEEPSEDGTDGGGIAPEERTSPEEILNRENGGEVIKDSPKKKKKL